MKANLRLHQSIMNCARLRLHADTTTIFVRDGWLIIESADSADLHDQLQSAEGTRLLSVAEVSQRTGFTAGAVRDWIKRSLLKAVRVGKEYRIREAELEKLIAGKCADSVPVSKRIGRRRKPVMS
ncbi:MAG: helix-turn-helix domain-containing protein [Verrucomicrobiota bacterium]|nr:helix-turn-helix domain-containing protein [Verrucomicrobiota bacterium]